MSDLVAFLRARLDEEEEFSRETYPGPWRVERNDPDRVLADVEAKRRIISRCEAERSSIYSYYTDDLVENTLIDLALPYAAHPEYHPDYRPERKP